MKTPLRALIVEDSEDDALLLVRQLERAGCAVTFERVASEAGMAAAFEGGTWDVVISDYSMPGFSGLAALAHCRSRRLDVPFILVSGTVGEDTAVEAMKAGAHDYLMKDNLTRLVPAVERELREAEVRRERRRAEQALRENEEKYRALYDNNPSMYFTVDARGTVLSVNRFGAARLGYAAEELVGRPVQEILLPDDREAVGARLTRCLRQPSWVHEWEARKIRKDGSVLWVKEIGRAVSGIDGAPVVLVVCEDITERKEAEERLVRLAAAVEQAADNIIMTDAEGFIRYVNPSFERTTGYTRAEVIGRKTDILHGGTHPESFYREMWETVQRDRAWQGRFTNRTRDGRLILQDASIAAINDAGGGIAGYVSTQRDVTRQVEMEVRMAQAQKLEAVGTLAGGIAHDFNNILGAIVGYTEMAQLKVPADAPVRKDLNAVLQASQRAAELVRQILTFSRRTKAEDKPVQVSLIVREALTFMRASIPTTIEIRSDLASDSVVMADPVEIHRMVVNLCTNAALAMGDDGGVLEVGLADVDLDAAFAASHPGVTPGLFLRLRVRDTGCGMTPEILARAFEPFYTTREEGKGTGMGLAVIHGIVSKLRGAITVATEPGRGTTFEVHLPVVEMAAPATPLPPEEYAGGHERIFVVDDEPVVARMIAGVLEMVGYRVRTFTDSREAMVACESDLPGVDLVLTDMTMPGVTGDVLARRVKALRPDLPVIVCTGYSERLSAEEARAQGIDAFLMKPVPLAELTRVVREVLDAR